MKTANIRRIVLDVDKARAKPSLIDVAQAIQNCSGVDSCNITVTGMDIETIGTNIAIEGTAINYDQVIRKIETTGAAVHSLDEIVVCARTIANTPWKR